MAYEKANPPAAKIPRLSAIVDKDALRREAAAARTSGGLSPIPSAKTSLNAKTSLADKRDDLNASPLHVEPYPARPVSQYTTTLAMDSPAMRHVENVYDR